MMAASSRSVGSHFTGRFPETSRSSPQQRASDRKAIDHFEAAIDFCQTLGAKLWTARVQCDFARFLMERGRPEDHEKTLELRQHAASEAEGLDSTRLKVEADSLTPS